MPGAHKNIPVGAESAHPLGYVQSTDPGAIGANRPWMDTTDAASGYHTPKIRNADDTGWLSPPYVPLSARVSLSVQFGDGVTADAAGAIRTVRVPVGLMPIGWIADASAAASATFTVEKSPAGAEAWSSLVGSGTAPALAAAAYAADTDGAVDWTGGSVAQYGAIRVTLATYTASTSKRVTLTIIFERD